MPASAVRRTILVKLVSLLLCAVAAAQTGQGDAKRPFTVKDSIGISYIVSSEAPTDFEWRGGNLPDGVPVISPDTKHFLLITQKGILSTNKIAATIWLFDRDVVRDFAFNRSAVSPLPKPLVTVEASSNLPVMSDVRWLDPHRISFLAKNSESNQQLFIGNIESGIVSATTPNGVYVTAYAISNDIVAYTSLLDAKRSQSDDTALIDVAGKDLTSLLYPSSHKLDDMGEAELESLPSTLHIQRDGQELPLSFAGGKPIKLFLPTLALSPDGRYLVTVAPVQEVPLSWEDYRPAVEDPKYMGFLRLRPGNQYAFAEENRYKASEWVLIDLHNGQISSLANAPAGRGLAYDMVTKAFWLSGGRRVIVSNTFLPLDGLHGDVDRAKRRQSPAVALADITNHTIKPITYLQQSDFSARVRYKVSDVIWNDAKNELILRYNHAPDPDRVAVPPVETYHLSPTGWTNVPAPASQPEDPTEDLKLSVEKDLNHPPVLKAYIHNRPASIDVWDPNPELERVSMVKVSIYRWHDKSGKSWSGLLAPPANYDPKHRYPLVIQLYGYDADRFFVDGAFTTGFAARALSGAGIAVLQIEWPTKYFRTPGDGPYQIDGFESAIQHLSDDKLIDPDRVGIIGFSYSTYHLLYAITHRPKLFAAAAFTDGNTVGYLQYLLATDTEKSAQGLLEETNGGEPFGLGLTNWLKDTPCFNLEKVKTPLLISSLEVGSLLWHWEPYSALRVLKKPVDMVWLPRGNWPHILVQPAHRYISQQLTVDWFAFWLKGDEDVEITKIQQYARWRALRSLQDRSHGAAKNTSK
jgi:hypothetical protein